MPLKIVSPVCDKVPLAVRLFISVSPSLILPSTLISPVKFSVFSSELISNIGVVVAPSFLLTKKLLDGPMLTTTFPPVAGSRVTSPSPERIVVDAVNSMESFFILTVPAPTCKVSFTHKLFSIVDVPGPLICKLPAKKRLPLESKYVPAFPMPEITLLFIFMSPEEDISPDNAKPPAMLNPPEIVVEPVMLTLPLVSIVKKLLPPVVAP